MPGLQRAGGGLGPGLGDNPGGDGRRHVAGRRAEGVDEPGAQYADWTFVLCRTEKDSQRHHGLSPLLVPSRIVLLTRSTTPEVLGLNAMAVT